MPDEVTGCVLKERCCLPAAPTDDVGEKSAGVNSKLLRRRQHCEELRAVGDVLSKLQVWAAVICVCINTSVWPL